MTHPDLGAGLPTARGRGSEVVEMRAGARTSRPKGCVIDPVVQSSRTLGGGANVPNGGDLISFDGEEEDGREFYDAFS